MVLLGDEAQVDACFGLFGDSANLDARLVQGLRRTYHRLRNHFGRTRWISYVTLVMWKLVLMHLETMVVSVQIGARFAPNISQKSFWTHPMVLLGDEAQVDARFSLFGDSAHLNAR
jgi:Cu/Ag efflux pump CusA